MTSDKVPGDDATPRLKALGVFRMCFLIGLEGRLACRIGEQVLRDRTGRKKSGA